MDLRKSIEKAKKMREAGGNQTTEEQQSSSHLIDSTPSSSEQARSSGQQLNSSSAQESCVSEEWMSPTYDQCNRVELNMNRLAQHRIVTDSSDKAQVESYKVLRAQILQRTREKDWRTVMITSASPSEGKTLTAISLGITFAKEFNQTVLLVDGDLRRQKIHQYLGIQSKCGLMDHLIDNRPMNELILWPGIEKLTLISGGKCVSDSSELLGSPKMKALVSQMKDRYKDRYILFDVPPILGGADTISFAPCVDCIIMVIESEKTSMRDVTHALELIPKEKFLGFVMNRHRQDNGTYYYY